MTVNINQLPALIIGWARYLAQIALLILAALLITKGLGFNLWPVASLGWQEAGVFLAGAAYALR